MAAVLSPKAAVSAAQSSLPTLGDDFAIEIFDIPQQRTVHGNAFPLGIRVKEGYQFPDIDVAVKYVEELALRGLFNKLLTNRS